MIKVAVGSTNKTKVSAVIKGFESIQLDATVEGFHTDSGVSDQPFSDHETMKGALNRAKNVLEQTDFSAEIGIGLEGGVVETEYGLFLCNWGALVSKAGKEYIAGGARIALPEEIAKRMRNGEELGPVMDDYTKQKGIRHHHGAIGIFTNGLITRDEMFHHVVSLLLGQWQYSLLKD